MREQFRLIYDRQHFKLIPSKIVNFIHQKLQTSNISFIKESQKSFNRKFDQTLCQNLQIFSLFSKYFQLIYAEKLLFDRIYSPENRRTKRMFVGFFDFFQKKYLVFRFHISFFETSNVKHFLDEKLRRVEQNFRKSIEISQSLRFYLFSKFEFLLENKLKRFYIVKSETSPHDFPSKFETYLFPTPEIKFHILLPDTANSDFVRIFEFLKFFYERENFF